MERVYREGTELAIWKGMSYSYQGKRAKRTSRKDRIKDQDATDKASGSPEEKIK